MHQLFVRSRVVAIAGFVVFAAAIAGCGGGGGGGTTPTAAGQQPSNGGGFTASQSQPVAAGGATIPLALPTGSGYGGSLTLPAPQATLPANTTATSTLTNTTEGAQRLPQFALPQTPSAFLVYLSLEFSNALTVPLPTFTITVPASEVSASAAYYLAFYDPQAAQGFPRGWQYQVEGPAFDDIGQTNATLIFSGSYTYPYNEYPYPFQANSPVYFGLYSVGGPAPSPTPTPNPLATPEPPVYVSPSTVQINGIGQTADVSVSDPTNCSCYSVASSNNNVASAYVSGSTLVITGNNSGFAGLTVSSAYGTSAVVNVTVTQTNVSVQGAHR